MVGKVTVPVAVDRAVTDEIEVEVGMSVDTRVVVLVTVEVGGGRLRQPHAVLTNWQATLRKLSGRPGQLLELGDALGEEELVLAVDEEVDFVDGVDDGLDVVDDDLLDVDDGLDDVDAGLEDADGRLDDVDDVLDDVEDRLEEEDDRLEDVDDFCPFWLFLLSRPAVAEGQTVTVIVLLVSLADGDGEHVILACTVISYVELYAVLGSAVMVDVVTVEVKTAVTGTVVSALTVLIEVVVTAGRFNSEAQKGDAEGKAWRLANTKSTALQTSIARSSTGAARTSVEPARAERRMEGNILSARVGRQAAGGEWA